MNNQPETLGNGIKRVLDAWTSRNPASSIPYLSRLPVVISPDWDGIISSLLLRNYVRRTLDRDIEVIGLYYTSTRVHRGLQSRLWLRTDLPLLTVKYVREHALWLDCDTDLMNVLSIGHHMLAQTPEDVVKLALRNPSMFNPNLHVWPHNTFHRKCPFNTAFMLWHALGYADSPEAKDHFLLSGIPDKIRLMIEVFVQLGDSMASFPWQYANNWNHWCAVIGLVGERADDRVASSEVFTDETIMAVRNWCEMTLFLGAHSEARNLGDINVFVYNHRTLEQWRKAIAGGLNSDADAELSRIYAFIGHGLFGDVHPDYIAYIYSNLSQTLFNFDDPPSGPKQPLWRPAAGGTQIIHSLSGDSVSIVALLELMENCETSKCRIVSHAITSRNSLSVTFNLNAEKKKECNGQEVEDIASLAPSFISPK